jgi:OOP family OmpA-OmpF porin
MFKKLVVASALTLMAAASSAQAAPGFYVGLDAGKSKFDGYENREKSLGGFAGYHFNDNLALEGGYRDLYSGISFDATQVSLAAVGTMPLGSGFNVFGRLGLNHLSSKSKFGGNYGFESATKVLYGVGLGYAFTPAISARIEFQKPASNLNNLSIGVAYKF